MSHCSFCNSNQHIVSTCTSVLFTQLCDSIYACYFTDCLLSNNFATGDAKIQDLSRKEIYILCSKLTLPSTWSPLHKKKALTLVYKKMIQRMMDNRLTVEVREHSRRLIHEGQCTHPVLLEVKRDIENEIYENRMTSMRKENWTRRIDRMPNAEVVDFYEKKIMVRLPVIWHLLPTMYRHVIKELHDGSVDCIYEGLLTDYLFENAVQRNAVVVERRTRTVPQEIVKPTIRLIMNLESVDATEDCPVCYEKPMDKHFVTTNCSHDFCLECIKKIIPTRTMVSCPLCRENVTTMVCHSNICVEDIKPFISPVLSFTTLV